MVEQWIEFNDNQNAGILLIADDLSPLREPACRVQWSHRTVIDGPLAEAPELITGFWLREVEDMDKQLLGEVLPDANTTSRWNRPHLRDR